MHSSIKLSIHLILLLCSFSLSSQLMAAQEARKLVILGMNDVDRMAKLPYVRTLRKNLQQQHGPILVLSAGDFLYPSLLSRKYQGAQMIDVMNSLDGDKQAFDPLMFVSFGNHEFDKTRLKHAAWLQQRIRESQFFWLNANVEFKQIAPGRKMVEADNLLPYKLINHNGIKIGLFGMVTNVQHPAYVDKFIDPVKAAAKTVRQLKQQGAELVIAVTHLRMAKDMQVLKELGDDAPDLIFGGHEHQRQTVVVNGRRIIKSDSRANSVSVVRVSLANEKGARPEATLQYHELPEQVRFDTRMYKLVQRWQQRFNKEYCADQDKHADCLDKTLGKAKVKLVAEELRIRRFETNLGNWLADIAKNHFLLQGAQIAFLNSGGMRINQDIPAGAKITQRKLDALLAYPMRLVLLELSGKTLQQVMSHAVTDWTGNGRWLQISGMVYMHDPENNSASQLHLMTAKGLQPIEPDKRYRVVTNDFLINKAMNQDGYTMLGPDQLIDAKLARPDLKQLLINDLAANPQGVTTKEEGRICNKADRTKLCLLKP